MRSPVDFYLEHDFRERVGFGRQMSTDVMVRVHRKLGPRMEGGGLEGGPFARQIRQGSNSRRLVAWLRDEEGRR